MKQPDILPNTKVLISVKTYPLPSHKYDELVCTAGFLEDGSWIRVYPVPFRGLPYHQQYQKWHWVTVDLIKNTQDHRPESYRPTSQLDIGENIPTTNNWILRKQYALRNVYTSMTDLLGDLKTKNTSLATVKPSEIIDFVIEPTERDWKESWRNQMLQFSLFDMDDKGQGRERKVIRKLPYKYFYKFRTHGDQNPRKLMIEDWELGALYWNCLKTCNGDENEANKLVRQKYFDTFVQQNDIHLFLGTTLQYHFVAPNPFVIIGVFYPKIETQGRMEL
ncbi:MAG TPA: hypothetical protein DEF47_18045 [Herpetosiphon sp.]|uniref:Uncharacterized protein n=1 Tax=Herpetosiphon aurantiacus (strain ATCC 23779 / DSM 785 / 114-95) TaxID=316274 RepID=A9B6E6_HERA2|nr:hypothetical protein [Herpetosiphon sp.]ABX02849.1 conserved hypothetical protein [Herpetosiphon aurantiacus DSM 785]HBW51797.1 hypothetical protein [Herpetosiphon sp.]